MARPLKYQTVEELQTAIDAYFERCEGRALLDENGDPVLYKRAPVIVDRHPPTVTGLAYALGFASRQALLNYKGRKVFNDAITRAKMRCEAYAEERLYDRDGARGAQFSLERNFLWTSQAETSAAADDGLLKALRNAAAGLFAGGDDSGTLPAPEAE